MSRPWKVPANGRQPRQDGLKWIDVGFDVDTFATVRGRAVERGTSFAEQIRLLVEWGLVAADEESRETLERARTAL